MDNEFLNGLILSYNKILKVIQPLKKEIDLLKKDVTFLVEQHTKKLNLVIKQDREKSKIAQNNEKPKIAQNNEKSKIPKTNEKPKIPKTNEKPKIPIINEKPKISKTNEKSKIANVKNGKSLTPKKIRKNNFQLLSYRKRPRKSSLNKVDDKIIIADKSNTDFFTNLGNEFLN